MTECPYCKGTSGYEYRVTIKGVQWNEWNGEAVNFENGLSDYFGKVIQYSGDGVSIYDKA